MTQTNGTDTPFNDDDSKTSQEDSREIRHAEDNFSEHNMLSSAELEALLQDNTPEGLEKIRELAEQYDIPFEGSTPAEIINRIQVMSASTDASYMYNGTE